MMGFNKCLLMQSNIAGEKVVIGNQDVPAGWKVEIYGCKIGQYRYAYQYSKTDWLCCRSKINVFKALTAPKKLHDGLLYFSSIQNRSENITTQRLKICFEELLIRMNFQEADLESRCQIEPLNESEWSIEIDLSGTMLEKAKIDDMEVHLDLWREKGYRWNFTKDRYYAACNADSIDIILSNFESFVSRAAWSEEEVIAGLEKWFSDHCDEDWEHDQVIDIKLKDEIWTVQLDAYNACNEMKVMEKSRNDGRWMKCKMEEGLFIGEGDKWRILNILKCFVDWCVE